MRAVAGKNVLLSLLLSFFLTLVIAVLYSFSPVIAAILGLLWRGIVSSGQERNGIVAVAGGSSESFFMAFILVAPILFLITFALLHKASRKN